MSQLRSSRKRKARAEQSGGHEETAIYDELGNGPLGYDDAPQNGNDTSDEEEMVTSESGSDSSASDLDIINGSIGTSESEEYASSDEIFSRKAIDGKNDKSISYNWRNPGELHEFSDDSDHDETFKKQGTSVSKLTTDANGNTRFIYREIEPGYDSDDSDAPVTANTIGNIPLSFYDAYPHIGYDINGKKISRPAYDKALDSLLDSIDVPEGWTGLTDPATGKPLILNEEQLLTLKSVTQNELPEDAYPEMVEYFTGRVETMPLSAAPEPKRRFVPSKEEAKRIMKIARAIKEGRIKPFRPEAATEDLDDQELIPSHDIWADEAPRPDHPMNIPAPKLPPPGHEESQHPPPEYLPDEEELREWEEMDEEDRPRSFLPRDHDALRKVPGYGPLLKERFERCLDLYLAPRIRRDKLNIDPESLLPKLPDPNDLKPFPSRCNVALDLGNGRMRSLAVDPSGQFVACGGDDGFVRIHTTLYGNQVYSVRLSDTDAINALAWLPQHDVAVLAAAVAENVLLISPDLPLESHISSERAKAGRQLLLSGANSIKENGNSDAKKEGPAKWHRPPTDLQQLGVLISIEMRSTVRTIAWHRRGDHFLTVSPRGQRRAVAIHTLSKHLTQLPFQRLQGIPQTVQFHPHKPIIFVSNENEIRVYDLARQELLKTLRTGARLISSIDIHPGGDNVLVGSYDKRLMWIDTELSDRPYKTLRYHTKAIRVAKFHPTGWPLFADASDDGTIQVFHGKVFDDSMENASIVPLKVLKGHRVVKNLGILDLDWHPTLPICISAGADGSCRFWGT